MLARAETVRLNAFAGKNSNSLRTKPTKGKLKWKQIAITDDSLERVRVRILPDGRMTREHAALYLGMKVKTLAMWAMNGKGPRAIRVGGRAFYRQTDLDDFIKCGGKAPRLPQARADMAGKSWRHWAGTGGATVAYAVARLMMTVRPAAACLSARDVSSRIVLRAATRSG